MVRLCLSTRAFSLCSSKMCINWGIAAICSTATLRVWMCAVSSCSWLEGWQLKTNRKYWGCRSQSFSRDTYNDNKQDTTTLLNSKDHSCRCANRRAGIEHLSYWRLAAKPQTNNINTLIINHATLAKPEPCHKALEQFLSLQANSLLTAREKRSLISFYYQRNGVIPLLLQTDLCQISVAAASKALCTFVNV